MKGFEYILAKLQGESLGDSPLKAAWAQSLPQPTQRVVCLIKGGGGRECGHLDVPAKCFGGGSDWVGLGPHPKPVPGPVAAGEAPSKTLVETAKEATEKAKETALAATEKAKDLANKAASKKQQQQQQFV